MRDSPVAIKDDDNHVLFTMRYMWVNEVVVLTQREDAGPEVDPSPPPPRRAPPPPRRAPPPPPPQSPILRHRLSPPPLAS
jgi:hypothetical protein